MAGTSGEQDLRKRLEIMKYDRNACIAAMRGEATPHASGHPLHRLCVIRGIRYHNGFAEQLCGLLLVFTRALNARIIMSNELPDLESGETTPYCIWHPETASEESYRMLVHKYPLDVHIAEEARESGNLAIYDAIVSQNVRYNIMNDYERCLDLEDAKPASLNGDTRVHWMLDIKQEFKDTTSEFSEWEDGELFPSDIVAEVGYQERTFNITEDMHIGEYESEAMSRGS